MVFNTNIMNDNKQQSTKNQDDSTNKIKEFRLKKIQNDKIAFLYEKLGDKKKASYLRNCSNQPVFYIDPVTHKPKVLTNFFCRQRLCPMCSWQRAKKTFSDVFAIISEPEFKNLEYIFITLTIKNCKGEDLQNNLDTLLSGWRGLTGTKRKPFRLRFTGMFRGLEITYNKKTNTYHPHLHVLCAVGKDYFSKTNKNYLSQEKLIRLWKSACNLDYEPSVDIRKVKNEEYKAVSEIAKYTVKSSDIANEKVLKVLDKALYNRRLISYHDLFKTVKAKLKIEDSEDKFISDSNFNAILANPEIIKTMYKWNFGTKTYNLVRVIESE